MQVFARAAISRRRGVFLDDAAIAHLQHPVHVLAHAQVMRDHDARAVLLVDQVGKGLHNLECPLGVEGGGGLIGQDERRSVDQRPGDGHALLLTAG